MRQDVLHSRGPAQSNPVAETRAASERWTADDAVTHKVPSQLERAARAYLITKHGDNAHAYEVWERAIVGHELAELFAQGSPRKNGP